MTIMTEEETNVQPTETDTLQEVEAGANDLGAGVDSAVVSEAEEDKEVKDEGGELFGKPDVYDYTDVKLPEGMGLNETMAGKLNDFAGKANLSQKGANELAALGVELAQQIQQQTVDAMGKLQEAKHAQYLQLLNMDKEVGGANYKESIETASLAYDAFFGDEELREIIAESGANRHPKFIKALKAIGSQMKQDVVHASTNPSGERQSREDILYPSMES